MLAYSPKSVIAEKLEPVVVLGNRNSRIKDFFDLHHLASRFEFDGATLAGAIRRTFERRQTPLPTEEPVERRPLGVRAHGVVVEVHRVFVVEERPDLVLGAHRRMPAREVREGGPLVRRVVVERARLVVAEERPRLPERLAFEGLKRIA